MKLLFVLSRGLHTQFFSEKLWLSPHSFTSAPGLAAGNNFWPFAKRLQSAEIRQEGTRRSFSKPKVLQWRTGSSTDSWKDGACCWPLVSFSVLSCIPASLVTLLACRGQEGVAELVNPTVECRKEERKKFATFKHKMLNFWMINLTNMCLFDRSGFGE